MDVVVIDVPNAWGMLLSRKSATSLGGIIQMDPSYATIPSCEGTLVTLHRELAMRYQVEDSSDPMNEIICVDEEFCNLCVFANSLAPMHKKVQDNEIKGV